MNSVNPRAVLLLLTAASNVTATDTNSVSSCNTVLPIRNKCFAKTVCYETITSVTLPEECRFSANHNVTIDLTLISSTTIDIDLDQVGDIMRRITSFKLKSSEQIPDLSFLKNMIDLKNLRLDGNQFVKIPDTPFSELTNLKRIDLSFNNLTEIDGLFEFNDVPNVQFLSCAHNQINELAEDTFSQMKSLAHLDLSHNNITHLTERHFKNLTFLKYLNLNNNNIKNLDGVVKGLDSLKYLYANNNELDYLDREFNNFTYHLAELDLSGNRITNIKNDSFVRHWKHFRGFCKILLSSNQIKFIPKVASEVGERVTRNINENENDVQTEIDLSNNSISRIEFEAFKYVINIVTLDLAINNLTTFYVNSQHLTKVEFLNLSNNHISYLYPHSFQFMNNLQLLDLSNNTLVYNTHHPFFVNGYFKNLNLSWNYFDDLKNLHVRKFHPGGGILDLSNNRLSRLQLARMDTENLRELILNSNNIQDASLIKLYQLNDLKRLEIKNNPIKVLNISLGLPSNLDVLDMSNNVIEDIGPATFHSVTNLKELYLRNNRLTEIKYGSFQGLRYLNTLDLSNNNITFLNSVVLMDLASLRNLYLKYTGINYIDYRQWLSHEHTIYVYLEGNEYSCDELSKALKDYYNGFSKMRPTVSIGVSYQPSLHGIPCKPSEAHALTSPNRIDERLLMLNQQVLEAIQNQTNIINMYLLQSADQINKYQMYHISSDQINGVNGDFRIKRNASQP